MIKNTPGSSLLGLKEAIDEEGATADIFAWDAMCRCLWVDNWFLISMIPIRFCSLLSFVKVLLIFFVHKWGLPVVNALVFEASSCCFGLWDIEGSFTNAQYQHITGFNTNVDRTSFDRNSAIESFCCSWGGAILDKKSKGDTKSPLNMSVNITHLYDHQLVPLFHSMLLQVSPA